MIVNLGLGAAFLGFLGVSLLLGTGHPGFAIKLTNYIYYLLVLSVLWGLIYENHKN